MGPGIACCGSPNVGRLRWFRYYYDSLFPSLQTNRSDEGNVVGIFATGPMSDNRFMNLLSEVIATFMFILAILCLGKMSDGLFPFIVGMLVASIGFSFGSTTGFALNPARDFGPRLAYAILPVPNRGTANWGYAWVPVIGPIIGATIAVLFFLAVALNKKTTSILNADH